MVVLCYKELVTLPAKVRFSATWLGLGLGVWLVYEVRNIDTASVMVRVEV